MYTCKTLWGEPEQPCSSTLYMLKKYTIYCSTETGECRGEKHAHFAADLINFYRG